MSEVRKSCPVHGTVVSCLAPYEAGAPCHFYNANSHQCVVFDISDALRDIPQAITMLSFGLGPKKPPRVLFADIDEYLKEIKADKEEIFRGIVRVTRMIYYEKDPQQEFYKKCTLYVISSYVAGDQVIQFKCAYGHWMNTDEDKLEAHRRAKCKAEKVIEKIQALCLDLLLDSRPGVLELKGS